MEKFSMPPIDLRRNVVLSRQALADFLRRSAGYVEPPKPPSPWSINNMQDHLRGRIRELAYPTPTELLTGGLLAGGAFELGRNFVNMGRDFGTTAAGYPSPQLEGLDSVKHSSAAQRAAQTAVKRLRAPYAGPGTSAWQRRMYDSRTTNGGSINPRQFDVDRRRINYLPRNASDTEAMAANDREAFSRLRGAINRFALKATGLGVLGAGGLAAKNYIDQPTSGFSMSADVPNNLQGFNFVPDPEEPKYSSVVQRVARMPYRGPGTAVWQRQMYPADLAVDFSNYSVKGRRYVPAVDAVDARAARYLPRNTSNKALNDIYEAEDDAASRKLWTKLVTGGTGLSLLGVGGVGLSQYLKQPDGFLMSSDVPAHLQGFRFIPE